eukprot:EC850211.1.p1 GENE.EC850211.1~~EC850211.1.p1  ORF type:complete len:117 (+),score=22.19 EC850211.1:85-435(+)
MSSLDTLLSQVYPYPNRPFVKEDVSSVCRQYQSLVPAAGNLVRTDGTESRLLQIKGTIPMHYGGHQYNVPLVIWITEGFPSTPPVVFVTPTQNMFIVESHHHVGMDGLVYHQYLSD